MREKLVAIVSARVRTVSVFANPGTPSSNTWPPARRLMSRRSIMYSCPTTRSATWRLTSWIRRASALDEAWVVAMGRESVERRVGDRELHQQTIHAPVRLQLLERLHLEPGQRADLSDGQVAKLDGTELHTHESVHLEAKRFAQPTDLAVLSFGDRDGELPSAAANLLAAHALRFDQAVLQLD